MPDNVQEHGDQVMKEVMHMHGNSMTGVAGVADGGRWGAATV